MVILYIVYKSKIMMQKSQTMFVCQQCGNEFSKWMGRCSFCGEWNSLVETPVSKTTKRKGQVRSGIGNVSKINKLLSNKENKQERISTNITEFDRALGGGLVDGQVVLIAGEPGIGKSTLLLQLADNLNDTLYISGEESSSQVLIRAKRLGVKNESLDFIDSTDVDFVIEEISRTKEKPKLLIVDSIQTMSTADLTGLAGSVGQVKECAFRYLRFAKDNNIPVVLVGHVTKEGTVAGPAVLAHIVDTVLWFEGDKQTNLRMLRAVKNRFGPTDEVGVFSMTDKGLLSFDNPEKIFIDSNSKKTSGSSVSIIVEGSRSILVEIQSLVVPTKLPIPRRTAQGIDSKRLEMLIAILSRRANINLYDQDIFVNVVGGIKIKDTSIDLAICLSIMSSFFDKAVPSGILSFGEVDLLGEIRNVSFQDKRIKDAKRLGFNSIYSAKNTPNILSLKRSLFQK